ncbi:MAG: hypothetical protein ACOC45_04745 [Alkalispirochaetaceae bacterium]
MLRSTKSFLNLLFFIFAATGAGIIYMAGELTDGQALFIPVALVAVYGFLVQRLLQDCRDHALADHHLDSIYFLGFLMTLTALAVFFYELQTGPGDALPLVPEGTLSDSVARSNEADPIVGALYYVGVSVTTSLAGVLFRNLARGAYLRDHPEEDSRLEETYDALLAAAERFTSGYQSTFERLELFLKDREEAVRERRELEGREREAAARFIEATEAFSRALTEARMNLVNGAAVVESEAASLARATARFSAEADTAGESTERLTARLESMPLSQLTDELGEFRGRTRELNLVLDSLIEIIEGKVGSLV